MKKKIKYLVNDTTVSRLATARTCLNIIYYNKNRVNPLHHRLMKSENRTNFLFFF